MKTDGAGFWRIVVLIDASAWELKPAPAFPFPGDHEGPELTDRAKTLRRLAIETATEEIHRAAGRTDLTLRFSFELDERRSHARIGRLICEGELLSEDDARRAPAT